MAHQVAGNDIELVVVVVGSLNCHNKFLFSLFAAHSTKIVYWGDVTAGLRVGHLAVACFLQLEKSHASNSAHSSLVPHHQSRLLLTTLFDHE